MNREPHFQDTREHLLAVGETVMKARGFSAVGLAEILAEAGVPKGSFYHYFKSKEAFGTDLLKRYYERMELDIQQVLARPGGTGRSRLLDVFRRWATLHEGNACQQGCFAVKMSGEVSDLSEAMRVALADGMVRVTRRLADGIRAAQADGSVPAALEPEPVAEAIYALWAGADLMAKARRSALPLQSAMRQMEQWLGATG